MRSEVDLASAFSPRVNRLVREAHYATQSSGEVQNAWSYASTSTYAFMVCAEANLPLM
jgi:hypothetical protein